MGRAIFDIPRILDAASAAAAAGVAMSTHHDLRQQGSGFAAKVGGYLDRRCRGGGGPYVIEGTAVRCWLRCLDGGGWGLRLVDPSDRVVGDIAVRPSGMVEYGCADPDGAAVSAEGIAAAEALLRSAAAGGAPLG